MNFSRFFIGRPRFAAVLSLIILIAGLVSLPILPIAEYPEVVPPTVVVKTTYAGADTAVIGDTVAAPLEQAINGVEGMIYQSSQSTVGWSDDPDHHLRPRDRRGQGADPGAEPRGAGAVSRLPEEVQRVGVTTTKGVAQPDRGGPPDLGRQPL